MRIAINGVNLSVNFNGLKRSPEKVHVFLLHGFTGSKNDWNFLIDKLPDKYFTVTIDILGHGKSDSPADIKFYSEENLVEQLHTLVKYFGSVKNIFVGYSMGGRLALSYAAKHTGCISALILESTSPGIAHRSERELRLTKDIKLARTIFYSGVESFMTNWINQPFFNSLKNLGNEKLAKLFTERCKNNPVGLSNILTEFSQGKMTPKWGMLEKFTFPVLLVSGSLDKKYCTINKKVSALLKNSEMQIIAGCGHNVHLEKAEEFVNLVNSFLKKYF